jgi:cobalamin-dependent methionine synthase I
MTPINEQIDIDKDKILNRIGYDSDYVPSARISSLVNDYIENYHDLIAPSYTHKIRDIKSVNGNRIDIGDSIILKSHKLARLLERCDKVAVFALTIGNYLEEMVAYLAENGLVLQATVLDAIGSGTAEKLAAWVEQSVRKDAGHKGLVVSWRFSPGYCDWSVKQQKMVFQALGNDVVGITLNESMLMAPQKSISGIIGIGQPGKDIENYNPCTTCFKKNCSGRRR